ncbi:hypothetical protein C8R43DRAFT_951574 [Mycena crocata]|nr:hypothetical protein C8R43DRAFT_951574 [Mycena crocata]
MAVLLELDFWVLFGELGTGQWAPLALFISIPTIPAIQMSYYDAAPYGTRDAVSTSGISATSSPRTSRILRPEFVYGDGGDGFVVLDIRDRGEVPAWCQFVIKQELRPSVVFSTMPVFDMLRNQLHNANHRFIQFVDAKVSLDQTNDFLHNIGDAIKAQVCAPYRRRAALQAQLYQFRSGLARGSGKTSLLMALLGVAYAAQESWVLNERLRDIILFGAEYDEEVQEGYKSVCLRAGSRAFFEAGDMSEARCTLARAIYFKAEILLDDAALDVHTSKWIMPSPAKLEAKTGGKLILAEELQLGKVKWSAGKSFGSLQSEVLNAILVNLYLRELGGPNFCLVFLGFYIVAEVIQIFETWYLGYFASLYETSSPGSVSYMLASHNPSVLRIRPTCVNLSRWAVASFNKDLYWLNVRYSFTSAPRCPKGGPGQLQMMFELLQSGETGDQISAKLCAKLDTSRTKESVKSNLFPHLACWFDQFHVELKISHLNSLWIHAAGIATESVHGQSMLQRSEKCVESASEFGSINHQWMMLYAPKNR